MRREEGCEVESGEDGAIGLSRCVGIMIGLVGPFGPPIVALLIVVVAAYVVAIFFKAAPRQRIEKQLDVEEYHRVSSMTRSIDTGSRDVRNA